VLEENGKLLEDKKIMMEALQIMKTGDYKAPESKISMDVVAGKVGKILSQPSPHPSPFLLPIKR
jgi:hypothetical protein